MKNVPKVWTPPQPEEIARLTNMKKKRKDHIGGQSMYAIADGQDTNDRMIPSFTTLKETIMKTILIPFDHFLTINF